MTAVVATARRRMSGHGRRCFALDRDPARRLEAGGVGDESRDAERNRGHSAQPGALITQQWRVARGMSELRARSWQMGSQGCAEASASGCFAEQAWDVAREGATAYYRIVAAVDRVHVTGTRMSVGPYHCTISEDIWPRPGQDRVRDGSRTSVAVEEGQGKRHRAQSGKLRSASSTFRLGSRGEHRCLAPHRRHH
jgi:hypothetical protein